MCVGENCAPQATRYVKAQLYALYQNAVECMAEHGNSPRTDASSYKSSHALADFVFGKYNNGPQVTGSMFHANFDQPDLQFVCNHDVILRLKIKEGHYHLDYKKSPSSISSEKARLQLISKLLEADFRVSYEVRELSGTDSKIGSGRIRLLALDLSTAQAVSTTPEVPTKEPLMFYLHNYLEFLKSAGHHVFFSLPEFDPRSQLTIDHSSLSVPVGDGPGFVEELRGIAISKISNHLALNWLKATMQSLDISKQSTDWNYSSFAEYRSSGFLQYPHETNVQFHFELVVPRIKAICSKEAVVSFMVDKVSFYNGVEETVERHSTRAFTKWEIAFLVDIIREDGVDGGATRCKIDLNRCFLREDLCQFPGTENSDELTESLLQLSIDAFIDEYLTYLESSGQLIIYDSRWSDSTAFFTLRDESTHEDDSSVWTLDASNGVVNNALASWRRTVTKSDMGDFDMVIAASQSSINAQLQNIWNSATPNSSSFILRNWSYDKQFTTSFLPTKVYLLSNNRAIVRIHLEKGQLTSTSNAEETLKFEDWHLAFEVDLKMSDPADRTRTEAAKGWLKESYAYTNHGAKEDRALRYILLDLANAEFIPEYSRFDDLLQTHDSRAVEKLRTTIHHLRMRYFVALAERGLDILHAVPVWNAQTGLPTYALTDIAFHVYSASHVTRQSFTYVTEQAQPTLLILGMTASRQMPDPAHLPYSAEWALRARKGLSYGTIALSRRLFMLRSLFSSIARINATTTVIPSMPRLDENGQWKLKLTTWAQDEKMKDQECQAIQDDDQQDGQSRYKWHHHVALKYEHKGSGIVDGSYSVSCTTRNFVEFPAAARSGTLIIKLWGEVTLNVAYSSDSRSGSAQSSSKWSASIILQTESSGVKASTSGSVIPTFEKTQYEGELASKMFTDLESDLRALFPETFDLAEVLAELKKFEGVWQSSFPGLKAHSLCNPVFNTHGDLLFELQPHIAEDSTTSAIPSRLASTATTNGRAPRLQLRFNRIFSNTSRTQEPSRTTSAVNGSVKTRSSAQTNSKKVEQTAGTEPALTRTNSVSSGQTLVAL